MKNREELECWKFAAAAGWTLFLMAAIPFICGLLWAINYR